jgi:hypothetical protein
MALSRKTKRNAVIAAAIGLVVGLLLAWVDSGDKGSGRYDPNRLVVDYRNVHIGEAGPEFLN